MAAITTFRYPPSSATSSNPANGTNGSPAPTTSTQVGGVGPDANLHPISTDNSGNQNVNVVASVLPTGASTSAAQTTGNTSLSSIDGKTPALGQALAAASVPVVLTASQLSTLTPLSTVTANQGTGGVSAWKVDGSAVTQPVSAASLPLPTGASTSAAQTTANTSLSSMDAKTPSLGQALAAASTPVVLTAAQITTLTPLSSVAVTNAGTFATQAAQSGTWNITNVSGTISLPTGASTSAAQTTGNNSLSSIDTKTPALGQALAAASVPVVMTASQLSTLTPLTSVAVTNAGTFATQAAQSGTWTVQPGNTANTTAWLVAEEKASTATVTSVASSASSVSLLASNAARKNAAFFNDSTAVLYLKFGTTASTSSYTVQIAALGYYELPVGRVYTGAIDGIWAAANGNARITEL